jgi:hypothetical protein
MPKVLKAGAGGGKAKKKVKGIYKYSRRSGQKLNPRINLITRSSGLNQFGKNYQKTLSPRKPSSLPQLFLKNLKSMCNNFCLTLSDH